MAFLLDIYKFIVPSLASSKLDVIFYQQKNYKLIFNVILTYLV